MDLSYSKTDFKEKWNPLIRKVVGFSLLESLKQRLDTAICLRWFNLNVALNRGLDLMA